jgi:glycosyltransferase involved in cell wall biosynthesis
MKVFVWQWGRRGAGPRLAACLAHGLAALSGVEVSLGLSTGAEILRTADAPDCDRLLPLYRGIAGLGWRALQGPAFVARTEGWLRRTRPMLAICALPGPLDLLMAASLRRAGIPMAVIVHDADPHPGDAYPFLFTLNHALIRRASGVVALSHHVADRLRAQGVLRSDVPLVRASLPPFRFGAAPPPPPLSHGGKLRVLTFGRLLPYKGLDLLAEALHRLGPRDMEVRVVGQGPEGAALASLRTLPGVRVENRWVEESEIGGLIAWADLLVLPYREASQSGVAAAALAAGRFVLSTRVGGLVQQLGAEPLAVLCDADAMSIAAALDRFVAEPPPVVGGADADAAWRGFARTVLDGLGAAPSWRG